MGQVMIPGGEFRLHTGVADMAHGRVANQFGVRGLAGEGDPRGIPARGPTKVLPLVRGSQGWFYLSDGHRAQTRGMGDAAADYAAIAANYPPTSAMYQLFMGCSANPGAPQCAAATAQALQSTPGTESLQAMLPNSLDIAAAQAGGYTTAQGTFIPGPGQPQTPQEAATAVTGKPNQSVPPTDTSTPMPTGTGSSGGNPVLCGDLVSCNLPTSSGSGLLIVAAVIGGLLLLGKR